MFSNKEQRFPKVADAVIQDHYWECHALADPPCPVEILQRGVRGHTTKPVSSLCVRKWSCVPGHGLGDPDQEFWLWERADWKGFWTQPGCSKEVPSQSHCHIDCLFFLVSNSWSSIWSFLAECHQPPHLTGKQKWAKPCPVLRSVDSQF